MQLDILLRGQSNAFLLAADTGQAMAQEVAGLLGFTGTANQVRLLSDWYTPGAETIVGASAFLGDWMRQGSDGQWQPQAAEQGLLTFAAQHQGATSTAVLWLHSEYDGTDPALQAGTWAAAVRAEAALLRQALGQDAATAPYMFVSAIPYEFSNDAAVQAVRAGMEQLAADTGFNAAIAARAQDLDMTFRFDAEGANTHPYGGDHMSAADATLLAHRIAASLAQEWAGYALPGSPVALAGGNLANLGPMVVAATPLAADTLEVQLAPDAATTLAPLGAAAASGLGWSVQGAGGTVWADHASLLGTTGLSLHFSADLPAEGTLFYGYGYGRLAADGTQPGQGNAVYDSAGLPAWTPANGVALAGVAPTSPAVVDWNLVAAAQNDWFSATGSYWGGPVATLLAWESTQHAASAAAPDWNALAATVLAHHAAGEGWYL